MSVRIALVGKDEIARHLATMSFAMARDFATLINNSSLSIQNRARELVPVDTGRLRSSIRAQFYKNGLAAEISTNVNYAMFVEFGTGRRGSATGTNLPPGYQHGARNGVHARPFLWPAFEEARGPFEKGLKDVVSRNTRSR